MTESIYAELISTESKYWNFKTQEDRIIRISKEWRGWKDESERLIVGERYVIRTSHDWCCSKEGMRHFIKEGYILSIHGKGSGGFSVGYPVSKIESEIKQEKLIEEKKELEKKKGELEEANRLLEAENRRLQQQIQGNETNGQQVQQVLQNIRDTILQFSAKKSELDQQKNLVKNRLDDNQQELLETFLKTKISLVRLEEENSNFRIIANTEEQIESLKRILGVRLTNEQMQNLLGVQEQFTKLQIQLEKIHNRQLNEEIEIPTHCLQQ